MIQATSCGGVVIFRGKILVLYKNYKNKYEGWVLPKGTVEPGEEYKDTAAREVLDFVDSGYYKFHEAYHLLKFANEKQILERAYNEYVDLKKSNLWGNRKYY